MLPVLLSLSLSPSGNPEAKYGVAPGLSTPPYALTSNEPLGIPKLFISALNPLSVPFVFKR